MEFDELFCLMSVATCLVMSIAMLWLVIPPTMGDDVKRPELHPGHHNCKTPARLRVFSGGWQEGKADVR